MRVVISSIATGEKETVSAVGHSSKKTWVNIKGQDVSNDKFVQAICFGNEALSLLSNIESFSSGKLKESIPNNKGIKVIDLSDFGFLIDIEGKWKSSSNKNADGIVYNSLSFVIENLDFVTGPSMELHYLKMQAKKIFQEGSVEEAMTFLGKISGLHNPENGFKQASQTPNDVPKKPVSFSKFNKNEDELIEKMLSENRSYEEFEDSSGEDMYDPFRR